MFGVGRGRSVAVTGVGIRNILINGHTFHGLLLLTKANFRCGGTLINHRDNFLDILHTIYFIFGTVTIDFRRNLGSFVLHLVHLHRPVAIVKRFVKRRSVSLPLLGWVILIVSLCTLLLSLPRQDLGLLVDSVVEPHWTGLQKIIKVKNCSMVLLREVIKTCLPFF